MISQSCRYRDTRVGPGRWERSRRDRDTGRRHSRAGVGQHGHSAVRDRSVHTGCGHSGGRMVTGGIVSINNMPISPCRRWVLNQATQLMVASSRSSTPRQGPWWANLRTVCSIRAGTLRGQDSRVSDPGPLAGRRGGGKNRAVSVRDADQCLMRGARESVWCWGRGCPGSRGANALGFTIRFDPISAA
jgi:hypothetical protein